MLIFRNSVIVASLIAVIAYAIYRYKTKRHKPISYEEILSLSLAEIKKRPLNGLGEYELVILPPLKAKQFIKEHPEWLDGISLNDLNNKLLVVWFVQQGNDVFGQCAKLSNSLASDFTDIVPADKVYRKRIKVS